MTFVSLYHQRFIFCKCQQSHLHCNWPPVNIRGVLCHIHIITANKQVFSQLNLTLEETILTLDEPAGVDTSTAQQRLRSITGRKSFIPGHRSWGREWCHPQKLLPRHNHMERCVKSSPGALPADLPSCRLLLLMMEVERWKNNSKQLGRWE